MRNKYPISQGDYWICVSQRLFAYLRQQIKGHLRVDPPLVGLKENRVQVISSIFPPLLIVTFPKTRQSGI